jgi:cobalamin biosynthesis protein CbiD
MKMEIVGGKIETLKEINIRRICMVGDVAKLMKLMDDMCVSRKMENSRKSLMHEMRTIHKLESENILI